MRHSVDDYAPNEEPVFVSYGMGLDSTAVLVGLQVRGIRPDLILFADTGAEKPETYAYLAVINEWLEEVGFPLVQVVRYQPVTATYTTLEGACLTNEVLPALAFNQHQCALRFKRDVLNKALKAWALGQRAIEAGKRIQKVIGYDNGASDLKRSAKALRLQAAMRAKIDARLAELGKAPLADQWEAANTEIRPLLQDWKLSREDLPALIESAGLPIPPKSACFFCPASKLQEVLDLKRDHRDLYDRAVAMETKAITGKHSGKTTIGSLGTGMGMTWRWGWIADIDDLDEAAAEIERQGGKIRKGERP
jgi:3'-phosphoadenosine 5'-phosphosulfate sulfotransferase (PAPS reductase)/FAD synthetase